jgi:hypothetical protein
MQIAVPLVKLSVENKSGNMCDSIFQGEFAFEIVSVDTSLSPNNLSDDFYIRKNPISCSK